MSCYPHRRLFQAVAKPAAGCDSPLAQGIRVPSTGKVAKPARRATSCRVEGPRRDNIRIEQLEISARLGVTDEERETPQRIVVSVIIWPHANFDGLEDDIARTINYVELCRDTRKFVQHRTYKLIETLAAELASHLLEKFPLDVVEVEVRKFVLPNTKYVSATARRSQPT